MLIHDILAIKSDKRELRKFGYVMTVALSILGGILLWQGKSAYMYIFVIAAALLVSGLLFPIILKPLHKVWMTLALILGWFTTRVILILLFYLIITPLSLVLRLFGFRFLNLRFDEGASTYWYDKSKEVREKHTYDKQY